MFNNDIICIISANPLTYIIINDSDTVYITRQLAIFVYIDGDYLIIIWLFSKCQNKTKVKLSMRENRKF
jgi:hypothetical protein